VVCGRAPPVAEYLDFILTADVGAFKSTPSLDAVINYGGTTRFVIVILSAAKNLRGSARFFAAFRMTKSGYKASFLF
jgi:hypothetical protein